MFVVVWVFFLCCVFGWLAGAFLSPRASPAHLFLLSDPLGSESFYLEELYLSSPKEGDSGVFCFSELSAS